MLMKQNVSNYIRKDSPINYFNKKRLRLTDKYKKHIEKSRSERSLRSPENMGTTFGKSNTGNHDLRSPSRPSWYQPDSVSSSYGSYHTGKEPIYYDIEDKGYSEGPAQGLQQNGRHKPDLISSTGKNWIQPTYLSACLPIYLPTH